MQRLRNIFGNNTTTILVILTIITVALGAVFSTRIIEQVDADEIVVIQGVTGKLTAHITPGPKLQLFGTVTEYPRRGEYSFTADTRFNDGGAGVVRGSIDWIMPLGTEAILQLHQQFGSAEAIALNLVKRTTDKSIYMTGPLLSSTQSYASQRTDLIRWIGDQINNGIYQTTVQEVREINALTGEQQTNTVASIRTDSTGFELRQEDAYLSSFGITTANFAVSGIDYDGRVQQQIDEQQANIMRVQTAQSEAREAEQRRITVEQQGLADAAAARAEREVEQAKLVTDAETRRQVAELDRAAADLTRQEQILLGQGEAERKRLVMNADGALNQKLDAWLKAQEFWANAFANYQGAMVPTISTGGASGSPVGVDFMEIMGAKAARDLSLDLSNRGGN